MDGVIKFFYTLDKAAAPYQAVIVSCLTSAIFPGPPLYKNVCVRESREQRKVQNVGGRTPFFSELPEEQEKNKVQHMRVLMNVAPPFGISCGPRGKGLKLTRAVVCFCCAVPAKNQRKKKKHDYLHLGTTSSLRAFLRESQWKNETQAYACVCLFLFETGHQPK